IAIPRSFAAVMTSSSRIDPPGWITARTPAAAAQGWMVVNEVRRLKNLPPIEGGDKLYQPKDPAPPAKPDSDDPERNPEDADS
ncbi:MAG: hypothetical protein ACE1Y7_13685, partial [Lysobacteraceae bacterium]